MIGSWRFLEVPGGSWRVLEGNEEVSILIWSGNGLQRLRYGQTGVKNVILHMYLSASAVFSIFSVLKVRDEPFKRAGK